MAKGDGSTLIDVKDLLAQLAARPAVYKAEEFTNRPFILKSVEWREFPPTEKNNYRTTSKAMMQCFDINAKKDVVLETTQLGIVEPITAIQNAGAMPCHLMIIKEGKFCSVIAR